MERCKACGATLAAGAEWCGQCLSLVTPPARSVMDPVPPPRPATLPDPPPTPVYSRWRSGPTSFGIVGRSVVSVLMLIPLWWFWETQMFAWPGVVIWVVIVMPWALRDLWRRSRVR